MGLAGADKIQVAFARYNRFVMALPSPARVVETRLHMRPAGGNATKLASRTQKETLSGPVWKARPAAIAAISSDSQSSAAKFSTFQTVARPCGFQFNRKANGWRFCGYTWSLRRLSSRQIGWPVTACLRPEAVALPRNAGCRFPALRSSEVASQRCDGMQLRVREVRLWSQQGKPLRDRCHCFHQTSPCQLRLLSILRQQRSRARWTRCNAGMFPVMLESAPETRTSPDEFAI
jgi:hypothetical protein